ncbi:DUF1883 domain-containing protein, partial [Micromonospora sp. RV43]|uniref:DUF1883 domain-containing protein n=1 Tax=Micromonospora sp. RV43 TaxID=1661387 RepID=UPI001F3EF437
ARVCLMDDDEYQAYVDGDEYEFFGGFYDLPPVVLEVPYDDHWRSTWGLILTGIFAVVARRRSSRHTPSARPARPR